MIAHVRSYGVMGRLIRWALTHWQERECRAHGWPEEEVWGNHDGLVCHGCDVGEAAPGGVSITPVETYIKQMRRGEIQVRLFEPIPPNITHMMQAQDNLLRYYIGSPYDYLAFGRLLYKSLVMDWSDIKPTTWLERWKKRFGDHAAGMKWANWCTEVCAESYLSFHPFLNLWGTANPTPMTTEQVAGIIKSDKVVTLREVTCA